MKFKGKPESKIPTTKTNTTKKQDKSLVKKNEFALIILGALLLTIIVFFLFFRSSGSKTEPVAKDVSSSSFADFEKRIGKMEQMLLSRENLSGQEKEKTKNNAPMNLVEGRLTRLETAFSVKFDSVMERIGKIEKNMAFIANKSAVTVKPKPVAKVSAPVKKVVKKAVKKETKTSLLHTVKKGETLYSISKKYKTSVAVLRKLNKFTSNTKIYPGNNILIR